MSGDEKGVVERLLGRPLREDEVFQISTHLSHPAPTGRKRSRAASELGQAVSAIAKRLKDADPGELERSFDETSSSYRRNRR